MSHKCFISFKKEDSSYKDKLISLLAREDVVGKALDREIQSYDSDYILQVIRDNYLSCSTVTLFLIGRNSSEKEGVDYLGRPHNHFIQRELQASLFNGRGNTRNGIVGIVLPEMYNAVYGETYFCSDCLGHHTYVNINDDTVIREFSTNYFIKPHKGCSWQEDDRYCVLSKWENFIANPDKYIDLAYSKRFSSIANKIKVRNFR